MPKVVVKFSKESILTLHQVMGSLSYTEPTDIIRQDGFFEELKAPVKEIREDLFDIQRSFEVEQLEKVGTGKVTKYVKKMRVPKEKESELNQAKNTYTASPHHIPLSADLVEWSFNNFKEMLDKASEAGGVSGVSGEIPMSLYANLWRQLQEAKTKADEKEFYVEGETELMPPTRPDLNKEGDEAKSEPEEEKPEEEKIEEGDQVEEGAEDGVEKTDDENADGKEEKAPEGEDKVNEEIDPSKED